MTIQEANKRAIKAGFNKGWNEDSERPNEGGWDLYSLEMRAALLDPLFWQALGKSMGWGMEDKGKDPWSGEDYLVRGEWQAQWHRLIDHLAEGKDIESFFAPL